MTTSGTNTYDPERELSSSDLLWRQCTIQGRSWHPQGLPGALSGDNRRKRTLGPRVGGLEYRKCTHRLLAL